VIGELIVTNVVPAKRPPPPPPPPLSIPAPPPPATTKYSIDAVPTGVTELLAELADEVPFAFVAVTVNV
jgi:hypothetical protein